MIEMDKTTKEQFLHACHTLLKNGPLQRSVGICANLGYLYARGNRTSHSLVQHYAQNWPLYSGDEEFPIPGGEDLYFATEVKWEGEQGQLRYDLLHHLIKETEKDLLLQGYLYARGNPVKLEEL